MKYEIIFTKGDEIISISEIPDADLDLLLSNFSASIEEEKARRINKRILKNHKKLQELDIYEQNIATKVKESLDKEYEGSSSMYTIFTIMGMNREEVEPVLAKAAIDGKLNPESIRHVSLISENEAYSFIIWGVYPDAAEDFSNMFPGYLVIGETDWNYFDLQLYINGKEAEKNKDYSMFLTYEESYDDNFYDTVYAIFDTYGNRIESGIGTISKTNLFKLKKMASRSEKGLFKENGTLFVD